MEQVYIIGKTDEKGKTEFLDYVFKDYSESRKMARKIVEKHNKNVIYLSLINSTDDSSILLRETTPDVWINPELKISIEVLEVKDLMKKRKIRPHIVKETLDKCVHAEILM